MTARTAADAALIRAPRAVAAAQKRAFRRCRCKHLFSDHFGLCHVSSCGCTRFRAAPSPTRGTRRSIKSEAKDAERDFANALGGRRLPAGVATQQRNGDVDVEGATWKMQVKHMPVPARWTEAWAQILTACTGTGKYPLVGIKTKPGQGRRSEMFVMLRLDDYVSLHGRDGAADE